MSQSNRTAAAMPPGGRSRGTVASLAVGMAALVSAAPMARADIIPVINIIPTAFSSETGQNSEPSLAVNPNDPNQMIAGAFSSTFNGSQVSTPYYESLNGGASWSGFGSLTSVDKSIAWSQNGGGAITTTLNFVGNNTEINTYQSGASNFGSPVNTINPGQNLDQPWVRTGPGGQTYLAYNNLSNSGGRTASIMVSSDNGVTYGSPVTLETVNPAGGQDAPSVRTAVNGNTVYAVFTRWGSSIASNSNGTLFGNSQVVIVKSTDGGQTFSSGVTGATTTGYFANTSNTPLTLGQNRTSSDVAVAVDPNNANHVVVVYGDAPETSTSSGLLQLHVIESTDGGATWTQKFTTPSDVRSSLPAVTINADGTIGLLYAQYDPTTNELSQHLVTTSNDFATTNDSLLGTESNSTPSADFYPYLGDFYDLTSVGNEMYGTFSASNADNGTNAYFPDATFQRDYTGTPGTASFTLTNGSGGAVPYSIDPYFFAYSTVPVPEPGSLALLATALFGLAACAGLRRRRHS